MTGRDRGSLRLIGGDWRGRRVRVGDAPGLRPTPDRVRETLFNWLAPQLPGSRCLDAFAGTGALGLEALSRGADSALFVERDRRLVGAIQDAIGVLGATGARVVQAEAPGVFTGLEGSFDIVFLDPPFTDELLAPTLAALPPLLAPGHCVYLEFDARQPPTLPADWQVLRDKRAGQVGYHLASWTGGDDTRPTRDA